MDCSTNKSNSIFFLYYYYGRKWGIFHPPMSSYSNGINNFFFLLFPFTLCLIIIELTICFQEWRFKKKKKLIIFASNKSNNLTLLLSILTVRNILEWLIKEKISFSFRCITLRPIFSMYYSENNFLQIDHKKYMRRFNFATIYKSDDLKYYLSFMKIQNQSNY